MKVFFFGMIMGFLAALYFLHKNKRKNIPQNVAQDNTELLFPLKPDYGEDEDKEDKEK